MENFLVRSCQVSWNLRVINFRVDGRKDTLEWKQNTTSEQFYNTLSEQFQNPIETSYKESN
jgi:hypothetical protein